MTLRKAKGAGVRVLVERVVFAVMANGGRGEGVAGFGGGHAYGKGGQGEGCGGEGTGSGGGRGEGAEDRDGVARGVKATEQLEGGLTGAPATAVMTGARLEHSISGG